MTEKKGKKDKGVGLDYAHLQAAIRAQFTERIANDTLGHAWLFEGAEGVGKGALAVWLAECIIAADDEQAAWVRGRTHPDVFYLHRAERARIGIGQVREMMAWQTMSSFQGGVRMVVVEEAELMTVEAANALLKTLEEPEGKRVFVLLATERRALPLTVQSRLQKVRLQVNKADIEAAWGRTIHDEIWQLTEGAPYALRAFLEEGGEGDYAEFKRVLTEDGASLTDTFKDDARIWRWWRFLAQNAAQSMMKAQTNSSNTRPIAHLITHPVAPSQAIHTFLDNLDTAERAFDGAVNKPLTLQSLHHQWQAIHSIYAEAVPPSP